jgi:nucleotide-binding universal stress UspA family protein
MSVFRKILVPTDYSSNAREAFRVAHDLARPTGASVVVFHVSRAATIGSAGDRRLSSPVRVAEKDRSDELLPKRTTVPTVRIEHEMMVADRPDAKHILRTVKKCGCDLIVMGTHVRAGRKRRLLGNMIEAVMRRAQCPVIVVTAPAHEMEDSASPGFHRLATRALS